MKKNVLAMILSGLLLNVFTPIVAEENDETVYNLPTLTSAEIESQIQNYLCEIYHSDDIHVVGYEPMAIYNAGKVQTWDQTQTYIGETTKTVNVGYAKNQYSEGVVFQGQKGYIYYSDSKGSDVSVSFTISWKTLSVGIGLGAKSSGVTGYALECPANTPCKAYVRKKVNVKLYHVVLTYEGQVLQESDVPVKDELQLYLSNGLA